MNRVSGGREVWIAGVGVTEHAAWHENTLALQVQQASGAILLPGRYSASEGARAIWSRFYGMMGSAHLSI